MIEVDKGIIKTLETLLLNPVLAWSAVVLLALLLMYLRYACIALSRRSNLFRGVSFEAFLTTSRRLH